MTALGQDIRQALALMRGSPGFTAATLVTIMLGVGGTTAVASVVYGVLLRPLPYPDPDRIVVAAELHPGAASVFGGVALSNLTYAAWAPRSDTLEAVATYSNRTVTLAGPDQSERLRGIAATPSLFRVLRVSPAIGRLLLDEDAAAGAEPVVVLGHGLWQQRFGGAESAIGQALVIDDVSHRVVGVTPAEFGFPGPEPAPLYLVQRVVPLSAGVSFNTLRVIARLEPGVSTAQAAAEGTAAARSVERPLAATLLFGEGGPVEVRVTTLADHLTLDARPALMLFSAGMLLVLVVATANVVNLFLSQGTKRARELAVRVALGAARGRLLRQLLTESLVVALAGGACGALLGWVVVSALPALAPPDLPRLDAVRVDAVFLAVALVVPLAVGVVAGLVPGVFASAAGTTGALHGGSGRTTDAKGGRLRSVLLVVESALAVMLLVGVLLLGRSFMSLTSVDPGYEPDDVLVATVRLAGASGTPGRGPATIERILERVRSSPDVVSAGAGTSTPFGDLVGISVLRLPGPAGPDGEPPRARALSATITSGFAEALGIRLLEGRFFQAGDGALEDRPVLVSEAFARAYLTDGLPIVGRRYDQRFGLSAIEIVGVVGDTLPGRLDAAFEPQIYFPQPADAALGQMTLIVRTRSRPDQLAPMLRSIVTGAEPSAILEGVAPLSARVSASVSEPRFAAAVAALFAVLGATLAATGLYGVLSFHVSRRRRELGIRAALGADSGRLVRLVLGQVFGMTALGVAIGLLASVAGSRALEGLLFGVSRLDAWSFAAAPLLLATVAAAASALPSLRAARVDPAEALRVEP